MMTVNVTMLSGTVHAFEVNKNGTVVGLKLMIKNKTSELDFGFMQFYANFFRNRSIGSTSGVQRSNAGEWP